jgi:hypothetical protein
MKLRVLATALAALGVLATACTTTTTRFVPDSTDPASTEKNEETDSDDVTKQPPHSLGVIVLGEAHASGGASRVMPIVSASFYPDALLSRKCSEKIAGTCEIVKAPKCNEVKSSQSGCDYDEACVYDDDCNAVCKRSVTCEDECDEDEVCQPRSGTSRFGRCVKAETFDAGPLAFSGTTTPITLFPPYSYESSGQGAPFLAGAEIKVQAQGAAEAGFEKFEESFTATTFLQTSPQLAKIPREKVFGTGTLPISWVPGDDTIVVTLIGQGGSVTCKAQDAAGRLDVPRAAVDAALGDEDDYYGAQSLNVTVARQKKDVRKGKKAKGQLASTKVQPEGWVELVTTSIETASFQGCGAGQAMCEDGCVDVRSDRFNCGACGQTCSGSQTCRAGKCTTGTNSCASCTDNAAYGVCNAQRTACVSDFDCSDLASCVANCANASCEQTCRSTYPFGTPKYDAFVSCVSDACYYECP